MKQFIFAGPLQHANQVGGIVFLFEDLIQSVDDRHSIFDTNGNNHTNRICMIIGFIRQCAKAVKNKSEIALHGTANDFMYLGFVLLVFNVLFGVKYHTRKFAGDFNTYYESMNPLLKFTTQHFLARSESNFFEPVFLVNYFKFLNPKTYWFPNYRNKSSYRTPERFAGKYVFVGHVRREKGIDTLLELEGLLKNGWTIDIYGPVSGYATLDMPHEGTVVYRGVLQSEDVQKVVSEYNCLILPSYAEGYPGVVIEAFSVGLPIIASGLPSLKEMVDDTCGVLTEPGSATSVLEAMQLIESDYSHYRSGSLHKFSTYDKNHVINNYFSLVGLNEYNQ